MKEEKKSKGLGNFVISFLLGALAVLYVWPPNPQIAVSSLDQERITWQLLNHLEDNGYDIKKSKKAISDPSFLAGWW